MKKTIFAALGTLGIAATMASTAYATQTGASVKVTELTAQREGYFYAKFSANICDDSAAAKDIGQVTSGDTGLTADGIKELFSALQAAKLSGSNVVVTTDGYTWGCRIKYVTIK